MSQAKLNFYYFFFLFFPLFSQLPFLLSFSFLALICNETLKRPSPSTLDGDNFSLTDNVKSFKFGNTSSALIGSYRSHHRNNLPSNQVNTHPLFLTCSHNREIINKKTHNPSFSHLLHLFARPLTTIWWCKFFFIYKIGVKLKWEKGNDLNPCFDTRVALSKW